MLTNREIIMENVRRYRAIASCVDRLRPSVHFKAGHSRTKPKGGNISPWRSSKHISPPAIARTTIKSCKLLNLPKRDGRRLPPPEYSRATGLAAYLEQRQLYATSTKMVATEKPYR